MATEQKKAPKPVIVEIYGQRIAGTPHVSAKTGSVGHIFNAKVLTEDGVKCQFNGNLTVVGSADAERAKVASDALAERKAQQKAAPAKS